MTPLLIKLLIAHLIGDFFLQPQKWVLDKAKKKLKSIWLYIHILIHIALMFLITWDLSSFLIILCIGVSHLFIDALKVSFQTEKNRRVLFFIDQLLHFIAILVIVSLFTDFNFEFNLIFNQKGLLLIACLLFLTLPSSIIMRTIFSKWDISKFVKANDSLEDAGNYIGILERVLVFIFIIIGQWAAVGFLITAKSVFRFGDLTASKERKLTEYVLIGTLISFGIAILTGLLFNICKITL